MLEIPVFWLGPLGRLLPLPCPESGVSGSQNLQAARNTTVNGRNVFDTQGFRREWVLNEAYMTDEDHLMIESMYTQLIRPPFRIIDPRYKNRLRANVAAPSSTTIWWGSNGSWNLPVNSGLIAQVAGEDYPPVSYTSPGDVREVSYTPEYSLTWTVSTTGKFLYPNGPLKPTTNAYKGRIDPILPEELVTMSFYVKKTGANFTFSVGLVDQDLSVSYTSGVTISSATWTRVTIPIDNTGDPDVLGVFPRFTSTGSGVLSIGPGQLETGLTATDWEPGYGAPETLISSMEGASPRYGLTTAALTITEL